MLLTLLLILLKFRHMPRKGKKQSSRLFARIKDYERAVSTDPNRKVQFTKPGSNKKSH